jgi:hypothetical protein
MYQGRAQQRTWDDQNDPVNKVWLFCLNRLANLPLFVLIWLHDYQKLWEIDLVRPP